jgi:ribosome-binding protein aMBF1 (putative translation factor)
MAVCEMCGRPIGGKFFREVNETFWEEYLVCENCIEVYKVERETKSAY